MIKYNDDGSIEEIFTDSEADAEWEEHLNSYLDDCVYPELPENMQSYFDEEKWKSDARMDGRGHSLGYYDGSEFEQEVNGEWFFIYRR